ncbi:MAG: hypothetical protein JJU28_01450 [Cyclobacteriaceae bacterium]|nr:hypothetical protein [Cyclobacteriaceae bacterium]
MKSFSSIFFILVLSVLPAMAQKERYIPSGIRFGADLPSLANQAFSQNLKPVEFTTDIDFGSFFLVADYGNVVFTQNEALHNYQSSGSYMRVGFDYNFLDTDTSNSVLFFGLRLGRGRTNETLSFSSINNIERNTGWPETTLQTANNGLRTSWFEFVTGTRIRIFDEFYMGFTIRYKISPRYRGNETLRPYYLPGFGRNIDESSWGFGYYIYYRIPWKKKIFPAPRESRQVDPNATNENGNRNGNGMGQPFP